MVIKWSTSIPGVPRIDSGSTVTSGVRFNCKHTTESAMYTIQFYILKSPNSEKGEACI